MWYKEWLNARYKVRAASLSYIAIGLFCFLSWTRPANYEELAQTWFTLTFFANLAVGALAGVDLVSEEKDKGTLGFLLSRPVSRQQVYGTKILFNLGWFSVIYLLTTLIMLGVSYLPITLDRWDYTALLSRHDRPAPVMALDYFVAIGLLVWLTGLAAICYTGFVSLFARDAQTTLLFSVLIVLWLVISLIIGHLLLPDIHSPNWLGRPKGIAVMSLGLGGVALAFYGAGTYIFRRKEV